MKYAELGSRIKAEREKRGWEQAELAARIGVGQQTVSRWESGNFRPKADDLHKLVEIFEGDINEWLPLAGYKIAKPVRPLVPHLPLDSLSEENFELFSRDFVQALNPGVDVHRYGTKGHKQEGIDLYAKTPGKLDYQCKRHKEFGPADVNAAVEATTFTAEHHHLLLSRIASPGARKAMDEYTDWSMWDVDDISAKVRALPPDTALRIIDTYFPGWRKDFLGVDDPSPWLSPNQFFQALTDRRRIFNHGWQFVGREKELGALDRFTKQEDVRAVIVSGRGGIGKSRLLRAWADAATKEAKVVFLSPGTEVSSRDYELLPGKGFLVIDDAHDRADLLNILSTVARMRPQIMVVISTRPYGLTRIQDELTRSGVGYDADSIITLGDLKEEDAERLSKEVIEEVLGDTKYAKPIAAITKDCPLATVVGSRLVAEGRIAPELLNNSERFRNELLRSFRNIIAGEVGGKDADAVRELLNFIAMVQPLDPNDPNFQEAAAKVLDRRFDKINQDMRALEDAGVLLRRSRRLRIAPDLLADFIRADASYDDRNKRPTGYVNVVFETVKDDLATNLLVNLSQLDWRLSADGVQAELLAEVWDNLKAQFKAAKIFARQTMLKAFAKISYYQPQQALEFAHLALDDQINDVENDAKAFSRGLGVKTSYRYVIGEVAPLLRYVAYHEDYVSEALDMLKELADADERQPNQYPDHPIRILRDLAGIEPGKPLVYNEMVLEHVLPWLKEPRNSNFSPFDVLDELLATEGHQSETKGITLSLKPFKVHAEAVKGLRDKVIDAAFDQLLDPSPQKSFRALETIEHALEFPHGLAGMSITAEEAAAWEPGIIETFNRLGQVVATEKLDPFLVVQIRGAASGRARYNKGAVKNSAEKVLDAIPTDREHEIARAMADGWGWTFEREGGTMRNEELCAQWRDKLAGDLLDDYRGKEGELIALLEGKAKHLKGLPMRTSTDYGPFTASLMRQSVNFTKALGEHLLQHPESPLVDAFGILIAVLAKDHYSDAIDFANRAVATGNVVLARCTSRALGWSLYDIPVTSQEADAIKALASSEDIAVRHNIARVVKRYGDNKAAGLNVLMSIRMNDSKEVADEVLGEIGKHGAFVVTDLTPEHLDHLHEQLVKCGSIEDYNIETFLSDLSAIHPERVVKLLMVRVEQKEGNDKQSMEDVLEDKYKPLPYLHRGGPRLQFSATKSYEKILRQVRDWASVETGNWMRSHYGADLFKMVSAGFDGATLNVLGEWINSNDTKKLESAAALLSEAPSGFVFAHPEYVVNVLEQAKKQGEACYKRVSSWLYGSAISGSRSGTPGQPFPQDIAQRDSSFDLMGKLPAGSPGYKFYKMLYEAAKANIERDTDEDLELD